MSNDTIFIITCISIVTLAGIALWMLHKRLPRKEAAPDVPPELKTEPPKPTEIPLPEKVGAVIPVEKMTFAKKIRFRLRLWHGWWSTILIYFLFYLCGWLMFWAFGAAFGIDDPSFIMDLFKAGCIVFGAVTFAKVIYYMDFLGLARYGWGKYRAEKRAILNYSKADWKLLTPCQRMLFFIVPFMFLVYLIIRVLEMLT